MLVKQCRTCGKDVRCYPCLAARKRFCSIPCKNAAGLSKTHGESRASLYTTWRSVKCRCNTPNSPVYAYYGGRGITVCDEWRNDYVAFRDWCIASGYAPGLELDRIDTNKGYEPSNCRWATRTQQMQNVRKRADAVTSEYKGVSRYGYKGKWRVQIVVNKKCISRAGFTDEVAAARMYDTLARQYFGEFAHLNFKGEG